MPIPTKEMVEANRKITVRNQDSIHREQQRLFIFLGQLYSLRSQIENSIRSRNACLKQPLNLTKYQAVGSQLSIELKNLINQVEAQMKNLKEIVGISDETRS